MTARENELVSIVLEPGARAALIALACGAGARTASDIARTSTMRLSEARAQLDRLVSFGIVRKQLRDKCFRYQLEPAFIRSL